MGLDLCKDIIGMFFIKGKSDLRSCLDTQSEKYKGDYCLNIDTYIDDVIPIDDNVLLKSSL